ncbi:DUF4394 domain-containing protein [Hymenobacter sp. BT683]|uniref:DUF4394 domain-containing protein n=2 Tax=Hymenobacter jeongseonensis TaxID=2791027 RepID=A0ABS0IDV4_9BACT|nr:DUF4394 domain-containing protein [Hymenobacter jeongseonensis]
MGLFAAAPAAQAQTAYGLGPGGTILVSLSLSSPTTPTFVPITGVVGFALVGLDSRPATGELFALGYNGAGSGQLYTINKTTGVATAVGTPQILPLGNATERIGFDFNPTVDRIRVTSSNLTNYRLNPNNGAIAAMDTPLNGAPGAVIDAVAYTNSFIGAASTVLYDVDVAGSRLYKQTNPNGGVLGSPVSITTNGTTPLLLATDVTDLDIFTNPAGGGQVAALSVVRGTTTTLYILDLTSGIATVPQAYPGFVVTDITFGIDRTAPAPSGQLLYAVNTNNALISFYSGTPGYILSAVGITGIVAGQTLVGTDFRPNTGELFGLGYDGTGMGQLYLINRSTGVASAVGTAQPLALGTTPAEINGIGFDFNPTVDRIRVTGYNTKNFRLNPNNGAIAATDGDLNFVSGATGTPTIGAVAYTNSFAGSTSTTLYDIDDVRNQLFVQSNPNLGQLTSASGTNLLPSSGAVNDLDFYYDATAQSNRGFIVSNPDGAIPTTGFSTLYTLNLSPMASTATAVGTIGLGIPVRDVAALIAPLTQPTLVGRLLYGVAGGNLISFDSSNPSNIRSAVNITGLPTVAGQVQVLVGLDFRPATGELFALGYNAAAEQGQLYTVNLSTGALTPVGSLQTIPLGMTASGIAFDFNPTVDRIRIISATNQVNLRMNPADGTFLTDTPLTNPDNNTPPAVSGAAYTNNDNNAATGTMLFGYDQVANVLVQATPLAPGANAANAGTYRNVGSGSGITVNPGVDFDVFSDLTNPSTPVNNAFLVASPTGATADNLYMVNLTSGALSSVGRIGNGTNLTGLAAFPTAPVVGDLTWTGAVSTEWGLAGNWMPMRVPTAADNVVIPNVDNDPVVDNAQQANSLTLASGATLTTAPGGTLTLNGNFVNNGGTTLGSGTGTVAFAGSAAQSVIGTTTFFNNLTVGSSGVTAAAPVQVQRVLLLNGNLASSGNLTLLSNATGTAHVVNASGAVSGNATVQRYITPINTGLGYRHYSAPVTGSTVADLATTSFTPVVNAAYNSAPMPNTVKPFPTVFGYDETRVNTSGSAGTIDFDKGFFSPAALSTALAATRGYTVNIPSTAKVDFVGILNNGAYIATGLTRGTQDKSGWHLLGNPYPSPITWDAVGRTNVGAAVYVYRSTSQYAGNYSSYVANGVGVNGGTAEIAVAQGFFVRVNASGNIGSVNFTNAARLTTYASPVFQRGANTAPLVRLDIRGASGSVDEAVVYFDAAATTGFDAEFDAYKLGGNGPSIATESESPATALAINGLPALGTADVVVNLQVTAPQAGTYRLRASELLRLPTGTFAYLRDAQTGARIDLATQPEYSFQLASGSAAGRFTLLLTQQTVLANAPAAVGQQISVFPNPARGAVSISLPAALARQATEVQLVNALGQTVLRSTLAAGSEARTLSLNGVSRGVYTLRLQTEQGTVNKRLVVE